MPAGRAALVIRRGDELVHVNCATLAERYLSQADRGDMDSCIATLAKRALGLLEEATGSRHKGISAALSHLRASRRFSSQDASVAKSLRALHEAHAFVRHLTSVGMDSWLASLQAALTRLEIAPCAAQPAATTATTMDVDTKSSSRRRRRMRNKAPTASEASVRPSSTAGDGVMVTVVGHESPGTSAASDSVHVAMTPGAVSAQPTVEPSSPIRKQLLSHSKHLAIDDGVTLRRDGPFDSALGFVTEVCKDFPGYYMIQLEPPHQYVGRSLRAERSELIDCWRRRIKRKA